MKFDISAVKRKIKPTDIIIGVVVLVLLGILVYKLARPKPKPLVITEQPKIEEKIENRFGLTIPDNVEKTELKDVTGGTGSAIATRTEILADLPDPAPGETYQVWLESNGKLVSIGRLRVAKGGWMLEYDSTKYPGYEKIVVSSESILDNSIETKILEGSFK